MCDWCEGGAADLVCNSDRNVWGEIDEETGDMEVTFYKEGKMVARGGRKVNFCPMCGKPVGSGVEVRFLKELRRVFNANISMEEIKKYAGSIGWNMAKQRVPEFIFKDDEEILCYYS